MTNRPFALCSAEDVDVGDIRLRAARLERISRELAAEATDLVQLAASLASRERTEPRTLLSIEDCAQTLGLSRTTTFGLIRTGQLPSFKVGSRRLVRRADLERFVSCSAGTPAWRAG